MPQSDSAQVFPVREEPASAAARAFLAYLETIPSPDVAVSEIAEQRRQIAESNAAHVDRARRRYACRETETVIAGVPCLEIAPPDGGGVGTIFYCFGGGHYSGDPIQDLAISAALAVFAGARVVAPNYRLAPEHPWPAAVDDACAVYAELVRSIPPERLAAVGESAGGNLVLAMLLRARSRGIAMPGAMALLSPWCDLQQRQAPSAPEKISDPTLHEDRLDQAAQFYAGKADRANPEISPILGAYDPSFPPAYITTGARDQLRPDCERLARALQQAGVPVTLSIWQEMCHVFEFYDEFPEAEKSLCEIAIFLAKHLRR